jgi:catechol 2,3-dioxygenase-like lactoylglutathione lyase family enzyme
VHFFHEIDHVQLAMPPGREDDARRFYAGILAMAEVPKPPELAKRGGVWFSSGNVQIHLGVEADFRPAQKAHPALLTMAFDELRAKLGAHGVEVMNDDTLPGTRRFYLHDCFGNRIEIIGV